jgi:hypothetical protein
VSPHCVLCCRAPTAAAARVHVSGTSKDVHAKEALAGLPFTIDVAAASSSSSSDDVQLSSALVLTPYIKCLNILLSGSQVGSRAVQHTRLCFVTSVKHLVVNRAYEHVLAQNSQLALVR